MTDVEVAAIIERIRQTPQADRVLAEDALLLVHGRLQDEKRMIQSVTESLVAAEARVQDAERVRDAAVRSDIAHQDRLNAAEARVDSLVAALRQAKNELGVPGPGYPAPVVHAVAIIDAVLDSEVGEPEVMGSLSNDDSPDDMYVITPHNEVGVQLPTEPERLTRSAIDAAERRVLAPDVIDAIRRYEPGPSTEMWAESHEALRAEIPSRDEQRERSLLDPPVMTPERQAILDQEKEIARQLQRETIAIAAWAHLTGGDSGEPHPIPASILWHDCNVQTQEFYRALADAVLVALGVAQDSTNEEAG